MSEIAFQPGAQFQLFGRVCKVMAFNNTQVEGQAYDATLDLIDQDGVCTKHSLDYLLEQYAKKNIRPIAEDLLPPSRKAPRKKTYPLAQEIPEKDLALGISRKRLLLAVNEAGGLRRGTAEWWRDDYPTLARESGFHEPPAKRTIKAWVRKVGLADGIPIEVVLSHDRSRQGGRGGLRLVEGAIGLLQRTVEDHYFVDGATFASCHQQVVDAFRKHNAIPENEKWKIPGYKQLVHFIMALPAYEVVAAKFGKTYARTKFTSVNYRNLGKLRPLERVEIDHTPLDILAVDDSGVMHGRVRLTLVIDVRTRAILGYSIGFNAPSAAAVLEALRHACTPKTYLKDLYPTIRNPWIMYGMMGLLAMDNGAEFHSKAKFKASVIEFAMSSEFAWMPRMKGRYKGLVEAIQKYINRKAMDTAPGATGSHPHTRAPGEAKPEDCAVFKISHLNLLLHSYICDIHNVTGHGKAKAIPNNVWKELTSKTPVRLPGHFDRLELACTEVMTRRIQPYGLEVADLRSFNCDALRDVRMLYEHEGKGTVEVQVRVKDRLLDKVWFKHPGTAEWIEVPNNDPETRDKSAFQVSTMRRMQRQAAAAGEAELGVAEAFRRMRDIGLALLTAKTVTQRKKGMQLLGMVQGEIREYLRDRFADVPVDEPGVGKNVDTPALKTTKRKTQTPRTDSSKAQRAGVQTAAPHQPPPHTPQTSQPPQVRPANDPVAFPKPLRVVGGNGRPLF